jgi:hypothetical protein
MNKKLFLAALAGTVVAFLLGWLIYGLLLDSFMKSNMNPIATACPGLMKEMGASFMILILISNFLMALFITFIFQRWAKFEHLSQGLIAGMFFGFFFALSYDLSGFAMMNLYSVSGIVADVIANTVITGITGVVIVWVLGYKSKAAPAL